MKKVLSVLLAVLLLCGLFTGCAQKEQGGNETTTTPTGDSTDGTTQGGSQDVIEVILPTYRTGEDAGAKFFEAQVERFNKEYEGKYKIIIEESPSNTHTDRIKQLALQGELPTIFQCSDSK